MKVLLSWLREFVPVPDSPHAIARTLSLRGFAVEGIEVAGDDAVLDFEVTSNRPDCMSVVGMAREVATAYGLPLQDPARDVPVPPGRAGTDAPDAGPALAVTIDDPDLCSRYVGAVADVAVGPSPGWMQRRLQAAGVRPISNIVDVTNYVLLELGQPMHAFDLQKLAGGRIRVRLAQQGESLRTLDGQQRLLSAEMLVIADAARPVAIAGVMGGTESEVTDATSAIVLESAHFNPLSVRRTSRRLAVKTEASTRFERGTDPALPLLAMHRAIALLETIDAGRSRGRVVDNHARRADARVVHLRRARILGILGGTVPDPDVSRILEGLGFVGQSVADGWNVTVPTRRVDVTREVDLVEEVARHYGFDRLPVTFPALTAASPQIDPRIGQARQLRGLLTGAGFFEAVTFGFIGDSAAAPFAAHGDLVPIANPLSENFSVLRPSLLPGLIGAVAHNRRREQRDVRLFEVGARFTRAGGERRTVACAWTGAASPEHWSRSGRMVDFFDIKALAERVCESVGAMVSILPSNDSWLAPGRRAAVHAGERRIGTLGQLESKLAGAHGLPDGDEVFVAEIDLEGLEAGTLPQSLRVTPLPKYPSVTRDLSILIDEGLPAADVRRTVTAAAPPTLIALTEFDRYHGKGIPEGKVSLSLRLTFRSSDRTLTDSEVQTAMEGIVATLKDRHAAVQR